MSVECGATGNSNSTKIVCVGAATLDTIYRLPQLPSGPGKFLAIEAVEVAHGMAASAAAAIAKLGGRSVLLSRLGEDLAGARIIDDLTAAGVDCTLIRKVAGARSPICTVLVDATGERTVIPWYDEKLSRDTGWLAADMVQRAQGALADVRWPEGAAFVLNAARKAGIPAVLDADVAPVAVVEGLAPLATHAVYSEPAALACSGLHAIEDAVIALGRCASNFVAATIGEGGCVWFDRNAGEIRRLAPPKVRAVDTLAAGDVFHGAFALAVAEGQCIEEAIGFANAAAALKCRVFGGRLGAPSRADVENALVRAHGGSTLI